MGAALHVRHDVRSRRARNDIRMHYPYAATHCVWQDVDEKLVMGVMKRYFGTNVCSDVACDVFLVEGVPAIAFTRATRSSDVIDAFYGNVGLMTLFDIGPRMRCEFVKTFGRMNISDAENKDIFLHS